jgi:D-alanyl-D-alanine carboxypeptidase
LFFFNFNIISLDQALKFAKNYSVVGPFTRTELVLLEKIFYENATTYGFYGTKVLTEITASIPKKNTLKIPHTGHFLFHGESEQAYKKIKKDIGENITLTSGVRGIVKQMYLFLNKVVHTQGNISMASRSLAPPGYSYHGISDFDVGKVGLGAANFTELFAETEEYRKLIDLGYVKLRYPEGNLHGVRFEPWHISLVR